MHLPADPQAWTQLQQLKLRKSIVWLPDGQVFQFSALTQLTQLDLGSCYFAQYSGARFRTHTNVCTARCRPLSALCPLTCVPEASR